MKLPPTESPELATLLALGFGPDASLMTEPKLFLDERLLGALVVELEDELGYDLAARTLFQIGLIHGLRDADRLVATSFLSETDPAAHGRLGGAAQPCWTPLLLDLDAPRSGPDGIQVEGRWPERHEAGAWLARLGPGDGPSCWLSCGYTSGWLSGTLDADVLALETECAGCGDDACHFVAREPSAWSGAQDDALEEILRTLGPIDFAIYRALALRCPSGAATRIVESEGSFDPDAPLVHIWGPVMVLPFVSPDDILRTTEALSRDPGTVEIRSVVVDLRGVLVDEGFGAAAIERVLETIETWGAEPILTGVAAQAEPVIAGLETRHLVVRKDLSEAIAAAFQIVDAQRHVV